MPNLTTLADCKTRFGYGTSDEALVNLLLPEVDADVVSYVGRPIFAETGRIEYPIVRGLGLTAVRLALYPVTTLTSLHISTAVPRVYDATTAVSASTGYGYDANSGMLFLLDGRCFPSTEESPQAIKVVYNGGYSTIPGDIKAAAEEILATKFQKSKDRQYHVTNITAIDGQVQGIRWEDIPPSAKAVLDRFRDVAFA